MLCSEVLCAALFVSDISCFAMSIEADASKKAHSLYCSLVFDNDLSCGLLHIHDVTDFDALRSIQS